MTNTNELTAKLKAAAQELDVETWHYARPSIYGSGYIINGAGQTVVCTSDGDVPAKCAGFIELANPANILALTEALEAAEKDAKQWKEVVAAFCADDADWHKLTTSNNELISQLSIALCKQADRIAELEARTLTVKLPLMLDSSPHFNGGVKSAFKNFEMACAAAGIKLQIEGE